MITRRTALKTSLGLGLTGWAGRAVAAADYWPRGAAWASVDPAAAGFDAARLGAAVDVGLADRSVDVLVLRGGRIVAERYAAGSGPEKTYQIASAAKSMISVLVGICIDQGRIKGIDQSASDFIPQWRGTPKAGITVRHLLSMTSGLDDRGLALRGIVGDQFEINAAAPVRAPPGARWAYQTAMFHLLYHVIERAAGEPFEAFATRNLTGPLGMKDTTWVTNTGQGAHGPVTNYYTASCSARDLARFGLFAQRGGRWAGRQLVSAGYLKRAISPSQDLNGAYGFLWWENARPGFGAAGAGGRAGLRFEGSPPDTFAALGAGGQAVMVVPSLDLVVIRQGQEPATETLLPSLLAAVCGAVRRGA